MTRQPMRWLLASLLAAFSATAGATGTIHASHAWIRLLPGDLPAGAYVTLVNDGDKPMALVGATSDAYSGIMLHHSSSEGGMSRMTMAASVPVPAHGQAALAPAGYHLMLMHAAKPVSAGERVKLTLDFADGSSLPVEFVARPANAIDDTH
jgi:copper(I)-binding protein